MAEEQVCRTQNMSTVCAICTQHSALGVDMTQRSGQASENLSTHHFFTITCYLYLLQEAVDTAG